MLDAMQSIVKHDENVIVSHNVVDLCLGQPRCDHSIQAMMHTGLCDIKSMVAW